MGLLLWAGFGIGLCSAFIHAALCVRRPLDRKYALFALMAALLCAYFWCQWSYYQSNTVEQGLKWDRAGFWFTGFWIIFYVWFVFEYAGLHIPKVLAIAAILCMTSFLIYNAVAPYSIFYSKRPEITSITAWGQVVSELRGPVGLMTWAYYLFLVLTMSAGIVPGVMLIRRGEPRRGVVLAASAALMATSVFLDMLRDVLNAQRIYMGEFGAVSMALVLAVQLAIDFRGQEEQLARAYQASLEVRDRLNTPLQTLALGLELLVRQTPAIDATVVPLRRAIARITELSQQLQRATAHDR